jgi:hypothetical protein
MITTQWIMTFFIGYIDSEEYLNALLDKLILAQDLFWNKVYGSIMAILHQNEEKIMQMNDISDVAIFFQEMSQNQEFGFSSAREFMQKSQVF